MPERTIPALMAPPPKRDNPLTRSVAGLIGVGFLALMCAACLLTLPWTLARVPEPGASPGSGSPRYDVQIRTARHLPPTWFGVPKEPGSDTVASRIEDTSYALAMRRLARERGLGAGVEQLASEGIRPTSAQAASARPFYLMGTDLLGRDLFVRCLAGGGISLGVGIAAVVTPPANSTAA